MTSPVVLKPGILHPNIDRYPLDGLTSHRQQEGAEAATDRAALTKRTAAKCRTPAAVLGCLLTSAGHHKAKH